MTISFRRPRMISAIALLAGCGLSHAGADPFNEVLESSLKEKKGVVLYVKGQALSGRVARIAADVVELTSREFTRIIVRRDSIDAVAGN